MLYLAKNYIGVGSMLKLFVVPTHLIQNWWDIAEPQIVKAFEKGDDEVRPDELRMQVAQGQQQLLMGMNPETNECHCAWTVQSIMYCREKVAYITYIGGRDTKHVWPQFIEWCKITGHTKVQGSVRDESIMKLWDKLYGMKKKYTTMEYSINQKEQV